jgi:hypothetical protein
MKSLFTLMFIAVMTIVCAQEQSTMKVNPDARQKLNQFIQQSKFDGEPNTSFNGLSNPKLKPQLNTLLNLAAKDFLVTASVRPTEKKFQDNIKKGLNRFNTYADELDTEDMERICHYFEELMDCVGLQSSNGLLNKWIYGFDPARKN